MSKFYKAKNVIFYDDNCVLCNFSVSFIIKNDPDHKFYFSPIQGNIAKKVLDIKYINNINSLVLLSNFEVYTKARALKYIIYSLYKLKFYKFIIFIPNPILNIIYNMIAKIRYKVFGKSKSCLYLDQSLNKRFLI